MVGIRQTIFHLYSARRADANFNGAKGGSILYAEIPLSSFLDCQPPCHRGYLIRFSHQLSYSSTMQRAERASKSKVVLQIITSMKNQLANMKISIRMNTLKVKSLKMTKYSQCKYNLFQI